MKRFVLSLSVLGLALVASEARSEGPTPQQAADYRHESFEALGKHMKATGMMVKGEAPITQADMVAHATAMNELSKALIGWFPEGSGPDKVKTDALPDIWAKRGDFEKAAKALQDESATLLAKAKANDVDGFKGQFRKVGGTCGGCHDNFRKDD